MGHGCPYRCLRQFGHDGRYPSNAKSHFNNYRIRALLYASKPNWTLLNTLIST